MHPWWAVAGPRPKPAVSVQPSDGLVSYCLFTVVRDRPCPCSRHCIEMPATAATQKPRAVMHPVWRQALPRARTALSLTVSYCPGHGGRHYHVLDGLVSHCLLLSRSRRQALPRAGRPCLSPSLTVPAMAEGTTMYWTALSLTVSHCPGHGGRHYHVLDGPRFEERFNQLRRVGGGMGGGGGLGGDGGVGMGNEGDGAWWEMGKQGEFD